LEKSMGKKLYVGNLAYSVNNASLESMFAPFGAVASAQVIQDRDTGRSKGFGFVEMSDENAAREAIKAMHDKEVDGRPLTVNEARPREERGGGGGGGGGGRGGRGGRW
jgi:RNA recognition motif-containing protein